ncbi:MAG: hypothetical protein ACK5KO_08360 [Arachnia sp.]
MSRPVLTKATIDEVIAVAGWYVSTTAQQLSDPSAAQNSVANPLDLEVGDRADVDHSSDGRGSSHVMSRAYSMVEPETSVEWVPAPAAATQEIALRRSEPDHHCRIRRRARPPGAGGHGWRAPVGWGM